jgi:hypothetical protein
MILTDLQKIAYKCRQRKKEWIDELAHKAERLGRENVYLRQLLLQLKEETLYLKTQLVMHKEFVQVSFSFRSRYVHARYLLL